MITKILLVAGALAISGAAYAGPSNTIPLRTPAQKVEVNKPYAAYVPAQSVVVSGPVYQGGPKSTIRR
jgi:hypothetical protein